MALGVRLVFFLKNTKYCRTFGCESNTNMTVTTKNTRKRELAFKVCIPLK
jgi:hypothetical protein